MRLTISLKFFSLLSAQFALGLAFDNEEPDSNLSLFHRGNDGTLNGERLLTKGIVDVEGVSTYVHIENILGMPGKCDLSSTKLDCYGDEFHEFGLISCDTSSPLFDAENCCYRITGLKACLEESVLDCLVDDDFDALEEVGCRKVIFQEALVHEEVPAEVTANVTETGTVMDGHILLESAVIYAQEDSVLDSYLGSTPYGVNSLQELHDVVADTNETAPTGEHSRVLLSASYGEGVITRSIELIFAAVRQEQELRETFAKEAVRIAAEIQPDLSWVMIYEGIRHQADNYIDHLTRVYHSKWEAGRRLSFHLYGFSNYEMGRFQRFGDGGFINWAYQGMFVRLDDGPGYAQLTLKQIVSESTSAASYARPSPPAVRLYEHDQFLGQTDYFMKPDIYSTYTTLYRNVGASFGYSSVKVRSDCCVRLYPQASGVGLFRRLCNIAVSNLGDKWNDKVLSADVTCSAGVVPTSDTEITAISITQLASAYYSFGTCGSGKVGNGICPYANSYTCCSSTGYCGACTSKALPTQLGDWIECTDSTQCLNSCCSGRYSGGVNKCTPLGTGYRPDICVGTGVARNLPEWVGCSNSNQCSSSCCSGKYSSGTLKCTPVGGFKPSEGCVGDAPAQNLLDWQRCSNSKDCRNTCCSGKYSSGVLKCTPLTNGYRSDICVGTPP